MGGAGGGRKLMEWPYGKATLYGVVDLGRKKFA